MSLSVWIECFARNSMTSRRESVDSLSDDLHSSAKISIVSMGETAIKACRAL